MGKREERRRQLQAERAAAKAESHGLICRAVLKQWHMVRTGRWFRWNWQCAHTHGWGYAPKVYAAPLCLLCHETRWELHSTNMGDV